MRKYVEASDRDGLAAYLVGFIDRMQAAGAVERRRPGGCATLLCTRTHAASPIPVFNIFEPLVGELKARNMKRVAVFGTRFVMESGVFGFVGNVDIVQARPEEVTYIHNTYMDLAQRGKGTEEQRRNLTALGHTLLDRDKADTIVLAGTDLVLLFNETNTGSAGFYRSAEQRLIDVAKADIEIGQKVERLGFGPTAVPHFEHERIFAEAPLETNEVFPVLRRVPERPGELKQQRAKSSAFN